MERQIRMFPIIKSTRLVTLSSLDQDKLVSPVGITAGFVVESIDSSTLEAAARRMVNKWRLLAGHLEWSKDLSTWCIRMPLDGNVTHRIKFTTSYQRVPLDTPIPAVNQNSAGILRKPSLEFFRHPSTPSSLTAFASLNAPLISIHISRLKNCTCIGISAPHGVFDVFGMGMVAKNLNAEFNGLPWLPPVPPETNILQATLEELSFSLPLYTEEPTALVDVRRQYTSATIKSMLVLAAGVTLDHFKGRRQTKAIYLGKNVVNMMVKNVKEDVLKSSGGRVSTGDILSAWLIKTIFSKDTNTDSQVCISDIVSMRKALAERDAAFEHYIHNCTLPSSMSPLSKQDLAAKSVAELAILHRQSIDAVRNLPFIQIFHNKIGRAVPVWRRDMDTFFIINQVLGRFEETDFGSEMFAYWIWNTPKMPPHSESVQLNRFKGGYILTARLRRVRWAAVTEGIANIANAR